MKKPPSAIIIGGSVGGLLAACLLDRIGWNVTVYERSAGDLSGRGAGLALSEDLLDVMRSVGARVDPSTAAAVERVAWIDASGRIRLEFDRPWLTGAWPKLYQPIRAVLPNAQYRPGMSFERVDDHADGVTAFFADGSSAQADLLIGADGNLSTVRRQFLPTVEPRYAGYVAWRGMIEEGALPASTQELLFGRIVYSFAPGELMLTMPIAGAGDDPRPGHRRCYFIWYRPADAALTAALFTDATGRSQGLSIPPPLIRPQYVAEMKAAARRLFAPALADVVERTAQPLLQAITDLEVPRLTFGRVVLLGDSAFVARPHVAAGTTKAARDARALANSLEAHGDDLPAALADYDRSQHAFGAAIVAHSRYLGAFLEAPAATTAASGDIERDPETLIRAYGAPHLLRPVDVSAFRVPVERR